MTRKPRGKKFVMRFFPHTIFLFLSVVNYLYPQNVYQEIEVQNGAKISGTVLLTGKRCDLERFIISKDEKICGRSKPPCTLILGKNFGVKNAIVSIENIEQGKKFTANRKPVLNQQKCEYVPHVMIAPLGAQLEILNSDPLLHNVHAYDLFAGLQTLFNIAQPVRGQRTAIKQTQLNKPGIVYTTCDAGHPWMNAYIMVAEHPYYALTDEDGNFTLDDVPPGMYTLKLWHEGIRIKEKETFNGSVTKYHFEEPYELTKQVSVSPRAQIKLTFGLEIRP